jgi:hypothetical protein
MPAPDGDVPLAAGLLVVQAAASRAVAARAAGRAAWTRRLRVK